MRIDVSLCCDGPSDRLLLPLVVWSIQQLRLDLEPQSYGPCRNNQGTLRNRIQRTLSDFPCDLLVIHRDAENEEPELRQDEIASAVQALQLPQVHVPIVPVRMTEAWLLLDEDAIRRAAGNPNGRVNLGLPPPHRLESLHDPKSLLKEKLLLATGLNSRRRPNFDFNAARQRIVDVMNYHLLRELNAYQEFLRRLEIALNHGWPPSALAHLCQIWSIL